jgi:transposase
VALLLSAHAGSELMVANPRAVRHFAKARMQRSKNDQLDAVMLREFAMRMEFTAWARTDKSTLALWAIARRLEALTKQCTAEKNRQHAAGISQAMPAWVRASVARTLRSLQREVKKLREMAREYSAGDARWRRRYQLLRTMPGIGEISALQILAELALLPADRDVRQWVASHCEPDRRGFYEHLVAQGKKKKQALTAVARKILHAIFGMFRWDRPYHGNCVYPLPLPSLAPQAAKIA